MTAGRTELDGLAKAIRDRVPKRFRHGTHRSTSPEQTLERVTGMLAPMGITRIANVTGLDSIGLPVVMVCRPNSRSLSVSQGKGLDLASAKASGVMEAIELYHGERIDLALKLGSYEDLRYTHNLVDVSELPRVAHSRFQPDLPLLWIEGLDLLQEEAVWVPFETVNVNYSSPLPTGAGCFIGTSNGLASGNHVLEAISHGLCEVVERDATTLWLLQSEHDQRTRMLDLDSVDDPACREVLERYERADISVSVCDTTTDVGIPAFFCTIAEREDNPARLLYSARGMGCHPTRHIALLRALTEAAQSRLTFIAGSRDDIDHQEYVHSRSPDTLRAERAQMQPIGSLRPFGDVPCHDGETFGDDLEWQLERLRLAGIRRAVAVDLTQPHFGIPVVRVVIPGLEGPAEKVHDYIPGRRAEHAARSQA